MAPGSLAVGRRWSFPGSDRVASASGDLILGALVAVMAFAVAYLVANGQLARAGVLALLPLAIWLVRRPFILVVALGASLPALMSVVGGSGGYHVAVSDLLLAMLLVAILLRAGVERSEELTSALRPVAVAVVPYSLFVLVLLPFHLSVGEVAQTIQRYELFLIPLAVGAFAALHQQHLRVLQAYIVATTALAIAWPVANFGMQKNPVGQLFANAIILLVALPALRRFLPCLLVLVPALFLTESRGAIAATAIGIAVVVAFRAFAPGRS